MDDDDTPGVGSTERRLGTAVQRLLGIVLVLTVVVVLVHPRDPNIDYLQRVVVAGLLGSAFVVAGAQVVRRRRPRSTCPEDATGRLWALAVLMSVIAGTVSVLLGWLLRYRYGWDANVVTGFSRELFAGKPLSAFGQDYLSRYPNNLPLLALMNLARKLGGVVGVSMFGTYLLFNGLCVAVTLLLTFVLVRMLGGARAAFVGQALVALLVALSPWSAVPYTDIPAIPLVLAAVTMGVAGLRAGRGSMRVVLVVGAFAAAGAGYLVKTTPATTAVALGLAGLVALLSLSRRVMLSALVLIAVGAVTFGAVAVGGTRAMYDAALVPRASLELDRTPPPTWWLANGLITSTNRDGRGYYGSFSATLVKQSKGLGGAELQAFAERRLKTQLRHLGARIVPFEVDKQAFVWGDGMFFAWGEGYDYQAERLIDHSPAARAVQAVQHPSGSWYLVRASLTNGVWLFVLLWAGVGLLGARYRRPTLLLVLTVLGIMAFLLLFQARSRYLFAYVPVVVALAVTVRPADVLRRVRGRDVAGDTSTAVSTRHTNR